MEKIQLTTSVIFTRKFGLKTLCFDGMMMDGKNPSQIINLTTLTEKKCSNIAQTLPKTDHISKIYSTLKVEKKWNSKCEKKLLHDCFKSNAKFNVFKLKKVF